MCVRPCLGDDSDSRSGVNHHMALRGGGWRWRGRVFPLGWLVARRGDDDLDMGLAVDGGEGGGHGLGRVGLALGAAYLLDLKGPLHIRLSGTLGVRLRSGEDLADVVFHRLRYVHHCGGDPIAMLSLQHS